jgi:hypothetical protein
MAGRVGPTDMAITTDPRGHGGRLRRRLGAAAKAARGSLAAFHLGDDGL